MIFNSETTRKDPAGVRTNTPLGWRRVVGIDKNLGPRWGKGGPRWGPSPDGIFFSQLRDHGHTPLGCKKQFSKHCLTECDPAPAGTRNCRLDLRPRWGWAPPESRGNETH